MALANAGARQAELAEHLNVTRMSVSFYLAGHVRPPKSFRDALIDLVGTDSADSIIDLIPTREAEAIPA